MNTFHSSIMQRPDFWAITEQQYVVEGVVTNVGAPLGWYSNLVAMNKYADRYIVHFLCLRKAN
jgi:hypothetical protein